MTTNRDSFTFRAARAHETDSDGGKAIQKKTIFNDCDDQKMVTPGVTVFGQ